MEEEKQTIVDKYVVSCGNYEGGLLGLSVKDFTDLEDIQTEYAFTADQVRYRAIANLCNRGLSMR